MAGLGEYGDEGFSSYHAKKNPFIIAQQFSATPLEMGSPAKLAWFLPMLAKVGAGVAKVGAGVAKGAAAVGKGVAAAAKGVAGAAKSAFGAAKGAVTKGVKGIGKIFGKKPAIGNISKTATKAGAEISVKGAGTGSFGIGGATAPSAPASYSTISKGATTLTTPSATATTSVPTSSTVSTASKPGFNIKAEIGKKWDSFKKSVPSRVKGSMDRSAAESKQQADELRASASSKLANLPTIEGVAQGGELESITESPSVYNKKYRSGPFRMRGWSPFTKKNSPLAGKSGKAFLSSITAKNKDQLIQQSTGAGYGIDPVTFKKIIS